MSTLAEQAVLAARELAIGYAGKRVRHEVFPAFSAHADKGELVALVGRNGQGKSTLLRTLIGLQAPLGGDVLLLGRSLHRYAPQELATRLSYVSTDNVKVGNLKVFDLVSLGRAPYTGWFGTLSAHDRAMVMQALSQVNMSAYAWRNSGALSDGERQRAMIARALAQDTPVIVLDEPTAFLDLPNRYEVVLLLKKLAQEHGRTIIFSTHDLNIALKIADRMWVMCDGQFYEGAPRSLMQSDVFERLLHDTRLAVDRESGEVKIVDH